MKTGSNGPTQRAEPEPSHRRPDWQLPTGVPRSIWEYSESSAIATEYDQYFEHHRLLALDDEVCQRFAVPGQVVVDFGCGTGRSLLPLARRGGECLGVDLSPAMLSELRRKAAAEGLSIGAVRANLVELDCLADQQFDLALCLFSTLGMISGGDHRRRFLSHVERVLRPGGHLILHVHNYWYNLRDPGGPRWLVGNLWKSLVRRSEELGDRRYDYRGVRHFFLHVFRRRALVALLRAAGLTPVEWVSVGRAHQGRLPHAWWCNSLRATGWIVVCRRISDVGR